MKKVVQKAGFTIVGISYTQRYGIDNFMNWFILGKPQLNKPSFETGSGYTAPYKWLENYYKNYLCKAGKSDTLILITKPKI